MPVTEGREDFCLLAEGGGRNDIVVAYYYVVTNGELILMSITYTAESISQSIATDCRMVQPCRPSSTAYKTVLLTKVHIAKTFCNQLLLD